MNELATPAEHPEIKAKIIPNVDTLENWEANDPILPLGSICVVQNAIGFETHFKIGLGNRRFSETPYIAMTSTLSSEYTSPEMIRDQDTPEGE